MASYNYPPPGPPGPPPPPSQGPPPPAPYTPYGNSGGAPPFRGGPAGGRGRGSFHQGAGGRGDPHPPYPPGPQAYPPSNSQYSHSPASYSQPSWPQEQSHHSQPPPANPLPPQNYHPNYAPQIYQQPQYPATAPPQPPAYQGTHPPQPPPQSQPYSPSYSHPPSSNPPPQHEWSPQHGGPGHGQHGYSGGRGRGGDRGGRAPPQVMGPPIRMGFSDNRPHDPAQASTSAYQSFPNPHHAYQPYPSYPPQAPTHVQIQNSSYDYSGGSSGNRGRASYHQNNRGGSRGHHHSHNYGHNHGHSNDKFRNQKSGGLATHHHQQQQPQHHQHPQQHQKPDESSAGKKKKRKTNPNDRDIGLIPSEAKEEGVDEEEELKELIGNALLEPTDVSAYIAARKACFPTKTRVEAKKAELAKLQAAENSKANSQPSKLEQKELEAARLRKRLEKLDSQIKRKREQHDEGDDMRDIDDSSSTSEEEDEKPEVAPATKPSSLPCPPSKADPTKHCKYYSTGGTCGKKGKCRFVHDPGVREAAIKQREANGGKLTLEQRLLLNDKDQEDLTVLKAIQHIKVIGKLSGAGFDKQTSSSLSSSSSSSLASSVTMTTAVAALPKAATHACLPPPHDSLPPHPPTPASPQVRREEGDSIPADLHSVAERASDGSLKEARPCNGQGNDAPSGAQGTQ